MVHIGFAKYYKFNGWIFEYDRNKPFGPWPCKKDYEPRKRAGKKFYNMFAEFNQLSIQQQEQYKVL